MDNPTRMEREKQKRLGDILSAAEELFCIQGFENTSMDDLARRTEYTKRTLYRYFVSKEDLFFAVALEAYTCLCNHLRQEITKVETGLQKIRSVYYAYYAYFCDRPQLLTIMNTAMAYKKASSDAESPYKAKYFALDIEMFGSLLELFLSGKADGSLRSDLDISQLALSSIFTAFGFFNMMSMYGHSYTSHFQLDKDAFVNMTIELFIDSLRNKNDLIKEV